jgi:hypothetical protein
MINKDMIEIVEIVCDLMSDDLLRIMYRHDYMASTVSEPVEKVGSPCFKCEAEWKQISEGSPLSFPQYNLVHEDTCPWTRLIVLTETGDD